MLASAPSRGAFLFPGNRLYPRHSQIACDKAQTKDLPMTPSAAPITQDVLTLPRKLPETGRINLVGLTRDQ